MIDLAQRSPSNPIKRYRIRQYGPITAILLIAAALYLFQIGTESIWLDEAFSIRDAQNLEWEGNLTVRPLYYLLLSAWMQLGTGEAWLRGLSAIFGVGSVFLTYRLGRQLLGVRTGLLAALLMALSPLFVNYAQEVRMYALGVFLSLAGTLVLSHVLERPTRAGIRRWVGLRLLMVLTTPLNVLLLLPDLILLILRFRRQWRVLRTAGVWLVLGGVAWLPFALSLAKATPNFMDGWVAKVPPPDLLDGITLPLKEFTAYGMQVTSLSRFMPFHEIYLGILVCLVAIALLSWRRSSKLLWFAAWGLLPIVIVFVGSHFSSSLWLDRYILFTAPYMLMLLAAGFLRVWRQQRIIAGIVALIYAISISSGLVHYYRVHDRDDWRGVAMAINAQEQQGDAIVLVRDFLQYPLAYYYKGSAPIYSLEPLFESAGSPFLVQFGEAVIQDALLRLPQTQSFWFIYRYSPTLNPKARRIMLTAFSKEFEIQQRQSFENIDLFRITFRQRLERSQ